MLNKEVREFLKDLIPINNSMIISDTMTGADEFKSMIFKANLGKLDKTEEFGIFDMAVFLQALDLLEDPKISFDNETSRIKAEDGTTALEYITSDVSSLDYIQIPVKAIDTTVAVPSVYSFGLDSSILAGIKKAKAVFKNFDTLHINSKTNEISIGNENTFSQNNNTWKSKVQPTINNKEFIISLPLDSIMKLPNMGYTLSVNYNEDRDAYRVVVSNELITFVLSLKD
jgi:hypothetical protein